MRSHQIDLLQRAIPDKRCLFSFVVKAYFHESSRQNPERNANQVALEAVDLAKKAFDTSTASGMSDESSGGSSNGDINGGEGGQTAINPTLPFKVGDVICARTEAFLEAANMATESQNFGYLHFLIDHIFTDLLSLRHSFRSESGEQIDYVGLENAYKAILQLRSDETEKKLATALTTAATKLFARAKTLSTVEELSPFVVVLMCPLFMDPPLHDALVKFMRAMLLLPASTMILLKRQTVNIPREIFSGIISIFHQFITVQLYAIRYIDERIAYSTRILGMLNDANEMRKDAVDYQEFYNDAVNNIVDLKQDYMRWLRTRRTHRITASFDEFCFAAHPFILDSSSKSKLLQLDAAIQQHSQLNNAIYSTILGLQNSSLYCVLRVRRDNLIYTALSEIMAKQRDLKKALRVVFIGEEGIDDGGLRTEFFNLVLKQIFDVNYGMFEYSEATRLFWFNPFSFETQDEFKLIGTIIALAIYNGIILDIKLPLVVYKQLLDKELTFDDLGTLDPDLHHGLQHLLDFEGNVEEVYCRTFEVEKEAFGNITRHELKPDGANIAVTNENRKEFVDLYTKWILRDSIKSQFEAFAEGFRMVCDADMLKLFRPEELELMICGTQELDFNQLERSAVYGSGYNKDHPTIKMFWRVAHGMTNDQKKQFLTFVTGSDRVPLKGLGSLGFAIIRNGDDSEHLPTSHVCYAYLMLPEYDTEEQLREKLIKAIENSEGFGLR